MMKTKTTCSNLYSFRSGLEEQVAKSFDKKGVPFEFETKVIKYVRPARLSRYTPDFILPNGVIIETKGRFETADRQKHLLIRDQHPDIDIRFVFSNYNNRISKRSKTTYGMWCTKYEFKFCNFRDTSTWLGEWTNE